MSKLKLPKRKSRSEMGLLNALQEEFNRFTGFFWRPVHDSSDTTSTYTLLYEEVDESMVELLKFVCPYGPPGDVEEFRFPRAGFANAKSVLRTVSFELDGEDRIVAIRGGELKVPLESQFELLEYIVRMGWTPDGQKYAADSYERQIQINKNYRVFRQLADLG